MLIYVFLNKPVSLYDPEVANFNLIKTYTVITIQLRSINGSIYIFDLHSRVVDLNYDLLLYSNTNPKCTMAFI